MSDTPAVGGPISTIGIVVFDGVERLDLEGPLGVFGWTARVKKTSSDGKSAPTGRLRITTGLTYSSSPAGIGPSSSATAS